MKSISILGCGWLGETLADELLLKKFLVNGSSTSDEKTKRLNEKGIKAFTVLLNPLFKGDHQFFNTQILLINIPPKVKLYGEEHHLKQIYSILEQAKKSKALQKIVFISSTSVYPNTNHLMKEDDAENTHFLKKAEDLIIEFSDKQAKEYLILRFGGLMGANRNPCKYFNQETEFDFSKVNYLHRDDAIGSILSLFNEDIWNETFNIVSPIHPTRSEIWANCISKKNLIVHKTKISSNKEVSPEKFLSISKYQFKFPDPLEFKYL